MTIVWIVIGSFVLAAICLWLEWRDKKQSELLKQYVLETMALEQQLALLNPRLARGQRLEPGEQAWLEKMLFERRITSDPTKWSTPDLGYDAVSGTLGEIVATHIASGGSPELLEIKSEQERIDKMQRMLADIGMPETQEQIEKWWNAHGIREEGRTGCHDVVLPGQRIYHAAVVRKVPFTTLYKAA